MSPRKFNPGVFQSDEEVIKQFVVRNYELDTVLEVLRENIDSPSCQHVLVVAPRGRGKSMLLARVAAELRTGEELSSRLLPVRFMEENPEISTLADFWLEALFFIAKECATQAPELARELDARHADLTRHWRDRASEKHARAAVLNAADQLGRKLVLMIENLQQLCEETDSGFGWKLRQVLQSDSAITLLATATGRFEALDDAREPFFELFRVVNLSPLDLDGCGRLWRALSGESPSQRSCRALQILTGGSPRLLVLIAGYGQHHSVRQLMESLTGLVDDQTEYFRSLMEFLPPMERRVYVAVLDLWQWSNAGEIAARARLDIRVVSAMLGRLVRRGAVVAQGRRRQRQYTAAERLHCIYFKLRRERDEAAVVESFIRFMTVFYSEPERETLYERLRMDAEKSPTIREGAARACARYPQITRLIPSIGRASQAILDAKDGSPFSLQLSGESGAVSDSCERDFVLAIGRLVPVIGHLEDLSSKFDGEAYENVVSRVDRFFGSGTSLSQVPEDVIAGAYALKSFAQFALGNPKEAIATADQAIAVVEGAKDHDLRALWRVASLWRVFFLIQVREFDAAIASCNVVIRELSGSGELEHRKAVAMALDYKAVALRESGDFKAALLAWEKVSERYGTSDEMDIVKLVAESSIGRGYVLVSLGDVDGAIALFEEVERCGSRFGQKLDEEVVQALIGKGYAFEDRGDFDQAIRSYEHAAAFHLYHRGDATIQHWVSLARADRETAKRRRGGSPYPSEIYERLLGPDGASGAPLDSWLAATALADEGIWLAHLGREKEALRTRDELERRLDFLTGETKIAASWAMDRILVEALLARREIAEAVDAFRSAYGHFVPEVDGMIRDVIGVVVELLAAGAPAPDVIDILSSDQTRADALVPLLAAVRQQAGDPSPAPIEILEVASDIRQRILQRAAELSC